MTITGSISNTSLTTAQLASHSHDMYNSGTTEACFIPFSGNRNPSTTIPAAVRNTGSGTGHNHSHTLSGTLTGNITTTLTGAVTASGTNSFSPFVIVNYIIKH